MQMAMEMCGCSYQDMRESYEQYMKAGYDKTLTGAMVQIMNSIEHVHAELRKRAVAMKSMKS